MNRLLMRMFDSASIPRRLTLEEALREAYPQ